MSNSTTKNIFRFAGFFLLFIVLFFVLLIVFSQRNSQAYNSTVTQESNINNVQNSRSISPSFNEMIVSVLHLVARDLRNNVDVNNDGNINCCDAAILFYQYFPDKNIVSITLNINEETGMNHLFNSVSIDGIWMPIEPQAFFSNYSSYWLEDIWGNMYDDNKNNDVTQQYLKYIID